MARRTSYDICPCGKRAYGDEHEADRALGRAQHKRRRIAQARGTARGMKTENRFYECDFGGFHLTEMSKRRFYEVVGVAA